MVQDASKREELCSQLWGEVQSAAATIGRRTLTSVLTVIIDRSPTTERATATVGAQVRKKSSSTVTPAKKKNTGGPQRPHSTGKRKPSPAHNPVA